MNVVRYELRTASELDALARTPLPLGIYAGVARGSSHRDLYLDTEDDALRARGVVCRLRIGARAPHRLTLVLGGDENAERVEVTVRATNAVEALAADTAVRRRLLSIVDPSALLVRVVLQFDRITIRRNSETRTLFQLCAHHRRGSVNEFQRLVEALEREHDLVGAEGDRRGLAELLLRWMRPGPENAVFQSSDHESPFVTEDGAVPEMLSPELSLLAFQRRVLALAEDPETPLRERLRFLGIVTSNLDEIYMVRMPELRQTAAARTNGARSRGMDGLTPGDRLERVEREIASVVDAHTRCAAECLRAAEALGTRILRWTDLSAEEQAVLRARCRDEIYPALTPLAMTLSPGHPLPHLPHLGLSLAVVFRRGAGSEAHLAELELPRDTQRLLPVPGRPLAVIPVEEVLRANVDLLYPNAHVDGAY